MRRPLLLVAAFCGCAGQIREPEWRSPEAAPASELVPLGPPAARYNDGGPPVPASALRVVQTVARIAEQSGRAAPAPDGRLCAVAAELATLVGDGPPAYDAEEFALAYHGIIEPSPHLLVIRVGDGDDDGVAQELGARLPPILAAGSFVRLGVGAAPHGPGRSTVVVALQESALETEPIPRELPRGGAVRLRGRVLQPFAEPKVYVTDQAGAVASAPVARDGPAGFRAEVRCGDADGRLKIEIVAEDRSQNPSVLANFPVFCGVAAPRAHALAAPAPAPTDPLAVGREIFDLVNRDRRRAGMTPLSWDDRAATVARRHSEEMRDKEFVAHVSPTTGTADDRARAGGLATPLLLENLARAYSPAEAEDGLMNSPGHRANLLNPQVTHLGVGVALGRAVGGQRELYVTQLFFRVTPPGDADAARRAAVDALARARARLPRVAEDHELDEVAQRYAGGLAAGQERDRLVAATDAQLDGLADRFSQIRTLIAVTGDPADSIRDDALDPKARFFGLGLAQGHHAELGDGAYFVVILLATAR